VAFAREGLYLEQFIHGARHIEVQLLADGSGAVIHLGERECSIQRRFQKLIEVAPSPMVTPELRARLGEAAIRVAKAVGYVNAGTVEFVVDPQGRFYAIEVNARLQVEHPVTEEVTGIDLVKAQLEIASGEPLHLCQEDVTFRGVALECRVYAEDPLRGFAPATGVVEEYGPPSGPGIRVESALYPGYEVTSYYDPLLVKLIAWGRSLEEARVRMKQALYELRIKGVTTNIALHQAILDDEAFIQGEWSNEFIEARRLLSRLREAREIREPESFRLAAAVAALYFELKPRVCCRPGPAGRPAWVMDRWEGYYDGV
jgi:acetyl-CoA carboxylase biotin carboxylase subunit